MKRVYLLVFILIICISMGIFAHKLWAGEGAAFQTFEYGTIRWGGRDNTHFIRPNGKVEMLGSILVKLQRPDRVDERSFYMNLAINAVATEGFEVAAMTSDEVLMKRPINR